MIKILTDTTASLTRAEFQENQIIPIPLYVVGERGPLKDLFDITPDDFYRRQREGVKFVTSPTEPETFVDSFRPVLEAGHEIICILLSSKISQCVAAAEQARQQLDPGKISIVDSRQSAFGQAYMALKARRMVEGGASRSEILAALEDLRSRTHSFFIVESLDHLKEGGRFHWDQAFIASLLGVKPIIWFDKDGKMKLHKNISSVREVRDKVLQLVKDSAKRGVEKVGLHYANNAREAAAYAKEMEVIVGMEVQLAQVSPVVGVHTGPDVLGPCIITQS